MGYGGTKTEMERLNADANRVKEANGEMADLSIDSFADVTEAIHIIQEEMGIAGATTEEASTTITGSVSAMRSAWSNLVTGLADDEADMEILIDNFVQSVVNVGKNLIPRIEIAVGGVGKLLKSFAEDVLPEIVETVVDNLPMIIETGIDIVASLIDGLIAALPTLVKAVPEIVKSIVIGIGNALWRIGGAAVDVMVRFVEGIGDSVWRAGSAGVDIVKRVVDGIGDAIWRAGSAGVDIVKNIASGIGDAMWRAVSKGKEIVTSVKDGIMEKIEDAWTWGSDLVSNFIDGVKAKIPTLDDVIGGMAGGIKSLIGFSEPEKGPLSNFHTYAPDMIDLFIKGVKDNEKKLQDQIEKTFDFGEKTISGVYDIQTYQGNSSGMYSGGVSVVQNIYSQAKTAADLMQEALYQQEGAMYLYV